MKRSKVRAPKLDGQYLVSPRADATQLIASNKSDFELLKPDAHSLFSDESLTSLRSLARKDLVQSAKEHTHKYAKEELQSARDPDSILLTGHQPELFHPGVWFKNFLLDALGKRTQSLTINLIIDNDESQSSISVPNGSKSNPHLKPLDYDTPQLGLPIENCHWQDSALAERFESDVKTAAGDLIDYPWILTPFWQLVRQAGNDHSQIGLCIARARHQLELARGVNNLDVPLSSVCQSQSFANFVSLLFTRASSFHRAYNESLLSHRRENKIRSQSRPVPALSQNDDWLELPFWIWTRDMPARSRLYVRSHDGELEVSNLAQISCKLSTKNLANQLFQIEEKHGITIRPRALITTLYARLVLSDFFIHGIGGAKYDELTDQLIEDFFGVRPPQFLIASSTHILPVGIDPFDEAELTELNLQQRERKFHPEKFLLGQTSSAANLEQKGRLLADIPPRGNKRQWHAEMERVNQMLFQTNIDDYQSLEQKLKELMETRRISQVLCSREFSFVLHPLGLIDQLIALSENAATNLIDC